MSPLCSAVVESLVHYFLAGRERSSAGQLVAGVRGSVKEERLQLRKSSCSWNSTATVGKAADSTAAAEGGGDRLRLDARPRRTRQRRTEAQVRGTHHNLNERLLLIGKLAELIHLRS